MMTDPRDPDKASFFFFFFFDDSKSNNCPFLIARLSRRSIEDSRGMIQKKKQQRSPVKWMEINSLLVV